MRKMDAEDLRDLRRGIKQSPAEERADKKNRKSKKSVMRKSGKTAGKTISTSARKRSATIVQHVPGKRGGSTRYRFPMPDQAHARNALARLPDAKGLSPSQKAKIKARAHRILGIPSNP